MPNRIIKESIKYSPQIDELSWFEEIVFYRLMVTADDYGCCDGRVILLKNELFPTRENVTKEAVEAAISKLTSVGLLCRYTVNGRPYLYFPTWEKHQRVRNKRRKYPEPPVQAAQSAQTEASAPSEQSLTASCGQMTADCPPESESESNPNPNPNPVSAEPPKASPAPAAAERVVIAFPLNTGERCPITEAQVREWQQLYPAVDVRQELRNMYGWLDGNPTKRKTKDGVKRFVHAWLSRCQNQGGSSPAKAELRSGYPRQTRSPVQGSGLVPEEETRKAQQEAVRRMQKFLREHEQEGEKGP